MLKFDIAAKLRLPTKLAVRGCGMEIFGIYSVAVKDALGYIDTLRYSRYLKYLDD